MDANSLKKYIFENDLVESTLEKFEFHSFNYGTNEIRCALPEDEDRTKVSIFLNENLSVRIFTKGETVYGSIIDLISFIEGTDFNRAYTKLLGVLGITKQKKYKSTEDYLSFFKGMKRKVVKPNYAIQDYLTLESLDIYSKYPHIDLIKKDGIIDLNVLKKYEVRFDPYTHRIIFPHFSYEDKNKIVGLIGRTVIPSYDSLKIPKYFSMQGIKYEKNKNLYGFSHNIEYIKNKGFVLVQEAEKSTIKADMFKVPCSVSVGSHDLSDFQKKLLISLGVEIIICFDKDVDKDHILKTCAELSLYSRVSYTEDEWELLKDKDAIVDRGYKKFHFLLRNRKLYM
ncbi:hypothetical protein [Halalkalibacter oceani]|uniref:hypothetical protein n=1 Tax=Halalkalibacter oceani TaxID=1653776 RepID=UPI00339ADFF6